VEGTRAKRNSKSGKAAGTVATCSKGASKQRTGPKGRADDKAGTVLETAAETVLTPEQEQEEPAVQSDTEYQQDAGDNEDPVYADDGYVDDVDRDERVRDGVDDVKEIEPLPAEIHHPAGRVR